MLRLVRRLSRFSLRGLLVAMTVCCLAMGGWSTYVKPYRDQAAALGKLTKLGVATQSVSAQGPEWQRWLVETMVHPTAYMHVVRADLRSRPLTAAEAQHLFGLSHLEELYLDHSELDAAGAALVGGFQNLRTLSLTYAGLDDAEFALMDALPSLETLYLTGNPISERSASKLRAMPNLRTLYVRWTALSQKDAARLAQGMPHCRVVQHALSDAIAEERP